MNQRNGESAPRYNGVYVKLALPVAIAAMVIAAGIFASGYFETSTTQTQTTTLTEAITSTSTTMQDAAGACLEEVPQSAVINYAQNFTFQGYSVTYANGTEHFFSLDSCPVPVSPDSYELDSVVEAIPTFIAAENGSTYAVNPFDSSVPSLSNATGQYAVVWFGLYSNQKFYPCGSSWEYVEAGPWEYVQVGSIQVVIPINAAGGLQLSSTEIQVIQGSSPEMC